MFFIITIFFSIYNKTKQLGREKQKTKGRAVKTGNKANFPLFDSKIISYLKASKTQVQNHYKE